MSIVWMLWNWKISKASIMILTEGSVSIYATAYWCGSELHNVHWFEVNSYTSQSEAFIFMEVYESYHPHIPLIGWCRKMPSIMKLKITSYFSQNSRKAPVFQYKLSITLPSHWSWLLLSPNSKTAQLYVSYHYDTEKRPSSVSLYHGTAKQLFLSRNSKQFHVMPFSTKSL